MDGSIPIIEKRGFAGRQLLSKSMVQRGGRDREAGEPAIAESFERVEVVDCSLVLGQREGMRESYWDGGKCEFVVPTSDA